MNTETMNLKYLPYPFASPSHVVHSSKDAIAAKNRVTALARKAVAPLLHYHNLLPSQQTSIHHAPNPRPLQALRLERHIPHSLPSPSHANANLQQLLRPQHRPPPPPPPRTAARRPPRTHQSPVRHHPPQLRGPTLPDPQRHRVPRGDDHGGHGGAEAGGVLAHAEAVHVQGGEEVSLGKGLGKGSFFCCWGGRGGEGGRDNSIRFD